MTTGAAISEVHSISDARTGVIRVSRLALTGWANATPTSSVGFKAWSDEGRMWGVYTSSTSTLGLYRRSTAGASDLVVSGTVTNGKAALNNDPNNSGISGTADVDNGTPGTNPEGDATFDVVVSYADETDLIRADRNANSHLASGLYPGGATGTRWESILAEAKMSIDADLLRMLEPRLKYDTWGRPMLAHLVRIGDLARAHAHRVMQKASANRGRAFYEEADYHERQVKQELARLTVQFDYERDLAVDDQSNANVVRLFRR